MKEESSDKSLDFFNPEICPHPENMFIPRCIGHKFILKCPDWSQTEECETYLGFIKNCQFY